MKNFNEEYEIWKEETIKVDLINGILQGVLVIAVFFIPMLFIALAFIGAFIGWLFN